MSRKSINPIPLDIDFIKIICKKKISPNGTPVPIRRNKDGSEIEMSSENSTPSGTPKSSRKEKKQKKKMLESLKKKFDKLDK